MKHPNVNKTPIFVQESDKVKDLADNLSSNVVAPIFAISNVTGQGLPKLKEFLSHMQSRALLSGLF